MLCHCVLLHLKVLGETGGDDGGPSKELHQATRRTKTIHARAGGEMTDASTDKAFSFFPCNGEAETCQWDVDFYKL